jgi:hypothetical protein
MPIDVTPSGIVTEVRPELWNALLPIEVTLLSRVKMPVQVPPADATPLVTV